MNGNPSTSIFGGGVPVMQVSSRQRPKRKGAIPIVRKSQDNVWQGTLDALGLESRNIKTKSNSSTVMADEDLMAPPPTASKARTSITNLPLEVQRNIIRQASSAELVALSLVSKHFRAMAAEELYRSFHIVFPDEDDLNNESTIDGLAGGLDTFVTSDYDYAKHLKEVILESLSGGEKVEHTYRHYLYSVSCGKFMNTLLLLTLRKAKALETFRWDIRVELSRQVFKALHQIGSLQNLHLRMQAGSSLYQMPPAIGTPPSPSGLSQGPPPPPPPHGALSMNQGPPPPQSTNLYSVGLNISQATRRKQMKSILPVTPTPPTLSAFKYLKTLSVLDMDTHEYMEELKTCIRASAPTLNTLRLSFSESLANKSRRPLPEVQSDVDSDQEDEFGQIIPGSISDPHAPLKVFKALEEKKKQEAVLGNILGWEAPPPKVKVAAPPSAKVEKEKRSEEDPKKRFIRNLAPFYAKLMNHVEPGSDLKAEAKEALDLIEKSCKIYLDSVEKKKPTFMTSAGSSTAKGTPASSAVGGDDSTSIASASDGPGLFDEPDKKKKKILSGEDGVANPEDIDMDEPEDDDIEADASADAVTVESPAKSDIEGSHAEILNSETKTSTVEPPSSAPEAIQESKTTELPLNDNCVANQLHILNSQNVLRAAYNEVKRNGELLKSQMDALKAEQAAGLPDPDYTASWSRLDAEWKDIRERLVSLSRDLDGITADLNNPNTGSWDGKSISGTTKPEMIEYVRNTRGLTLSTLELYLIPIKANVLSQTIDLHVLQKITLLNVGPQNHFWNLMASKNQNSPLPLHKINTDNVSLPFLVFVSQLDMVTELIMLERAKSKVESTAVKTTVTIDQIRKRVLKKHAPTLKILVMKNKTTPDWDLNIKTTVLLCQRAKKLEEFACSFGSRVMHSLLQSMASLDSLRALHAIVFRRDDDCTWTSDAFRKFVVDIVSQNPHMKLEYVALDSTIERLVRRKSVVKSSKGKGKGKQSDKTYNTLSEIILGSTSGVPSWEVVIANQEKEWERDSSDDDDDGTMARGLKIETVEGMRFCDVTGVRIFKKDVLNGSL